MNLNERQEIAKNYIDGPLLIIAGAGSGKTATIKARVDYMVREKNIPSSKILCVTFTNKAAKEMRERIAGALGVETTHNIYRDRGLPLIGTFHSLGVYLLKEFIETLGYKKQFTIYDEQDKLSIIKKISKDLNIDEKEYPSRQIAYHISTAKNSMINPINYEKQVDNSLKEVVAKVYRKYTEELKQNNALDFDDILIKTLEIVEQGEILEKLQSRYEYIMVDEYQDTNEIQYRIVKLLASKLRNLCVVGDDWQSIYSWRGANMKNILNFQKDYPEAEVVKLEQNYRSTKNIIMGANSVIKNNKEALKKTMWTDKNEGEKIQIIEAPDDRIESSIVAEIIKEKGEPYSKNLILYRTNGQSRAIEEALLLKGIPYIVVGGMKFYDRKEVKDLIAYLKVIQNSDDIVAMKRIINTPSRKIGAKTIETLDNYRENFGTSYVGIIENIEEVEELNNGAKANLSGFLSIYKDIKAKSSSMVVGELLEYIIKKVDYEAYLQNEYSKEEVDAKLDNIGELVNVASNYNGMDPEESLEQFLEEVALITDIETKKDETGDFVTLMTIHTAKGLEADRVFVMGCEESIFPHVRSLDALKDLEEERRLMYVAMTRAREELYISRARERFVFGNYVSNPASRFLSEIPTEITENYQSSLANSSLFGNNNASSFSGFGTTTTNTFAKKERVYNDIASFEIGDMVDHHKFGVGTIVDMKGEIAEIGFRGVGIKKMNVKIAPIKKVK